MKITAIIGSLRQSSIHRGIFESYKELAKEFFALEEGVIRNIPLYNEDDGDNDIAHQLAEQIMHSDGVIFFAPEYNYSIPGVLKNAIDWLSRATPQPFAGKPASIIGASVVV